VNLNVLLFIYGCDGTLNIPHQHCLEQEQSMYARSYNLHLVDDSRVIWLLLPNFQAKN